VAFTSPKTWSFGEILTSTDMNTYVRDNTDDLDTRVSALLAGGISSNVVQVVKTDTFTTSLSASVFTNVTGMSATITPSATSSKILIIVQGVASVDANGFGPRFRLTGGNSGNFVGAAAGSRPQAASGLFGGATTQEGEAADAGLIVYLDSPSTSSPVTYQLQIANGGEGTRAVFFNRTQNDGNTLRNARYASSITLVEVAA